MSIAPSLPHHFSKRTSIRGFTLAEIMVGAALAAVIVAGALSAFLFLGRSGANVQSYNDMEAQSRRCLEIFAEDVRQASDVIWNSNASVTLIVNGAQITYAYTGGAARNLSRTAPNDTRVLISGITNFSFRAYTIAGVEITDLSTSAAREAANRSTKQLQLSFTASRSNSPTPNASNIVESARFILRNKIVSG